METKRECGRARGKEEDESRERRKESVCVRVRESASRRGRRSMRGMKQNQCSRMKLHS